MKLYDYQHEGAAFLKSNSRAYLADQMGLGKSVQAIQAAKATGVRSILVVCPAVVVPHWETEFDKWWPERTASVGVISYSLAIRRDLPKVELLIADEAHYLKSPGAKRTRKVFRHAAKTPHVWLLSGTPMPNGPQELWAPIRALWPEFTHGCKTHLQWMEKFTHVRPTVFGPKPTGVRNPELLRDTLNKILLRRKLEDVGLELPSLRVDLTRIPKPAILGDLVVEEGIDEEDAYMSTLRRLVGIAKAEAVAQLIVDELKAGAYKSIVVFYHHRAVGQVFADRFAGAGVSVSGFDGSAGGDERRTAVDLFQKGMTPVFLAQQTAAGVGITLTNSTEVVLAEPHWTPSENEQAIKRIHRIGQDQPCRARIFAAADTLDEAIMGTITRKVQTQIALGLEG